MVQKINGFEKTFKVLEEIDEALLLLQNNFEQKKNNITDLKHTAEKSVKQIDNLMSKLDKVLE